MKNSHKIYLQGDLALRFGESFSFHGESVQDALRCIYANRPEFKQYLIDCHENNYFFELEVQNTEIDNPEEYFLPIVKGDIILSAIPAGSGSGFGKILAAAAMFALIFTPIGGSTLINTVFGSGTTAASVATNIGIGIATNLAMQGLAEILAPDPSVDVEEEGYLFNGGERTVAEGLPIPVLYGELRVPGYPISFELMQSDRVATVSETVPSKDGDIYLNYDAGDRLEQTEGGAVEKQAAEVISAELAEAAKLSRDQTAVFTDIISEGPIYGLVDGGSSVFLNDDPMQTVNQSTIRMAETAVTFTLTNGSSSVTINKNNYTKDIQIDSNGTKYLIIRSYATSASATTVEWTGIGDARGVKITTSSGFWADSHIYDGSNFSTAPIVRLLDSNSETIFEGYLTSKDSTTVGYCVSAVGSDISPLYSNGSYTVVLDFKQEISSVAANQATLTLASNFAGTSGTYNCDISSGTYSSHSLIDKVNLYSKYGNTAVQFRTGSLRQETFLDAAGTGVNNTAIGPGGSFSATTISKFQDGSGSTTAEFEGTSASGFGLTAAQAEEVDEFRVFFTYPQLWNRQLEKGTQTAATVIYTTQIAIKREGSYGSYITLPETRHYGKSNAPLVFEEIFDLKKYAPFEDFKIKFTRTTNQDQAYNSWSTSGTPSPGVGYGTQSSVQVTSLSSIIKENLRYPFTAMAKVQARASDFNGQIPKRSYLCKGLKVKVPSNYITADESSESNSAPSYKRHVTNGTVESTYQDWDGNFRAEKVYTNNPAWVFYDLLTNPRYGLGDWIDEAEIDKFALYRIGRYCDEMIDNGNGATEPRFTTNAYITRATDAYKVIKDLATVFRGVLYWLDAEVYPVIDQPSNPVYNFSKGNVIDGAFTYESSGSKTKFNQVVVKWNNPDNDYKLTNLVLEDRNNIVKTGKIISQDAVAFGCTSEGQAIRYGRWKLWTAINQTEVVNFKTSINAAFLIPGDIINVQDADRYPGNTIYSGRVSNTGTRNTTTVPLDRSIELTSGSTYKLSVLIEEPATFLAQSAATINSVSYTEGDLILADDGGSAITTESAASNLVDDSGNPVLTNWKPHTRAEEQTVSTSAGSGISSLTVSTAFSAAPRAETVWVLRETVSGVDTIDSKKDYKILSISQENPSLYSISAVEHYNEKFSAIEADAFSVQVQDPVFPTPKSSDDVPAPTNVYVHVADLGPGDLVNDVELFWDAPVQTGNASSIYPFIDGYEIEHNSGLLENPFIVSKETRYLRGLDIPPGTYTVGIRTLSQGKKSAITKTTFTVVDPAKQAVPRGFGMALGGTSNSAPYITSAGVFNFENANLVFSPAGDPQLVKEFDGSPASEYTQDCSNISSVNFSSLSTEFDKQLASHYIMFDGDAADPLVLVKFYQDDALGYGYFYDAGTGNTTHTSNLTSLTGTVSVAADSNKVVGSSTTFTTELQVGDILKFSSTQAAKVTFIASNTDVRIDKSFSTAISAGTSISRLSFRFDRDQDAIFAQIRNDSGTFKYFPVNLVVNKNLDGEPRNVTFTAAPSVILFDGSSTLTTSYSNLVLTAVSEGWAQPEFKITGAGFSNSDISQSAESSFSDPTSGKTYVKTLDKVTTYSATALEFTVTVRDKLDTANTNKQRSVNLTIPMVKDGTNGTDGVDGANGADGAAGTNARSVDLTAGSNIFTYNASGASPSPSSTTVTASANNTSGTVYYNFFLNDSSVQHTTSNTYTYTPQSSISNMPDEVEVEIREGSTSSSILARDHITMGGIQPGATGAQGPQGADGVAGGDGVDAITTFYTNQAHTVPVTNAGTETWTGSGGTLNIFDGTTELVLNSNTQTTSYPASNGRYNLNITNVSGDTLTEPTITGSGSVGATLGDFSGNLTQATQYELSIYVKSSDGTQYNPKFKISITPSFEGDDGATGAQGPAGANGANGDDGLRFAEGYVYYSVATTSAPGSPGSGTLTWSTGAISGMNANWQQSPPEMGAGASGKYYYARWTASQSAATDTTNSVTFGSVTLGHNFTGLVTFSSGTFQEDGSDITTIDGGNITTGTVSLGAIDTATSLSSGDHDFEFAATGISIAGSSYDATAQFRSNHNGDCANLFAEYYGSNAGGFGFAAVSRAGSAAGFSFDAGGTYGPVSGATNYLTLCSSTKLLNGFTGTTNGFYVLNNGNLWTRGLLSKQGAGATSPGANVFNFYWTGSAAQMWVDTSNIGTITVSSDYRIKQNITTQTATAVDRIEQLRPVTYMFADNPSFSWLSDGVTREGFIAHEVAEVIPSAVEGVKDAANELQSLNLDAICAVLVKAVQEQQTTIEALEARIEALETT